MKSITVAALRQNPSAALHDVEHGETYVVTRYRREVARLVPPEGPAPRARGEDVMAAMARTPLRAGWAAEVAADRDADVGDDPWERA